MSLGFAGGAGGQWHTKHLPMLNEDALKGLVQDAHRGMGDLSQKPSSSGGFLFQPEGLFHFLVGFLQKSETHNIFCKRNQWEKKKGKTISSGKAFALLWKLETQHNWRVHAHGE